MHLPLTLLATGTPDFKTPEEAHGSRVMTTVTACSVVVVIGLVVVVVVGDGRVVVVLDEAARGVPPQPAIKATSAVALMPKAMSFRTATLSRKLRSMGGSWTRSQMAVLRAQAGRVFGQPHQARSPGPGWVESGVASSATAKLTDWSPDSTYAQMRDDGGF